MRGMFIIGSALVMLASSALVLWMSRPGESDLTIVLIGHVPANDLQDKLTLAITNTTARSLEGYIAQAPHYLGGATFRLVSHSGTFVDAYALRKEPWIFGGNYRRSMGSAESKMRLFLSEHTILRERALKTYVCIQTVRLRE